MKPTSHFEKWASLIIKYNYMFLLLLREFNITRGGKSASSYPNAAKSFSMCRICFRNSRASRLLRRSNWYKSSECRDLDYCSSSWSEVLHGTGKTILCSLSPESSFKLDVNKYCRSKLDTFKSKFWKTSGLLLHFRTVADSFYYFNSPIVRSLSNLT